MTKIDKKSILLIALGGTIAMTKSDTNGITLALNGDDLVETVPGLAKVAHIKPISPFQLPGASLTLENLIEISKLIDHELSRSYDGVVVVQGTDTIEETAFVLDCLVQTNKPVVVTGAMRGPMVAGADGPANLLSSVSVAASSQAKKRGVLVVLNDEIHTARFVNKAHTALLSAFVSRGSGPIGNVFEEKVFFHATVNSMSKHSLPKIGNIPAVALLMIGLGDDGRFIDHLEKLGFQGAVVVAMGAGHVPQTFAEKIETLVQKMPVVLATRVCTGPVFTNTYGFLGSEIDLISKGVITSGDLGPIKARLLLQILLANGASKTSIMKQFQNPLKKKQKD